MTSCIRNEKKHGVSHLIRLFLVLTAVLILSVVLSLCLGSVSLSIKELFAALDGSDETARVILLGLRLPRALAAGLAGIGFAVSGTLLQSATNNDLCAPNVIGVNAGAGFAVMLVLCLFPLAWEILPAAAFVGALVSVFLVLLLSFSGKRRGRQINVILAGVAVAALLNAGISFLSLLYPDVLSSYLAFSVGGFMEVQIQQLIIPAAMIFICLVPSFLLAPKLNLLCLGDDMARSLGVSVRRTRFLTLILASALCAAAVSFAGLLGFVGLVVPHITRKIVGTDLRKAIGANCFIGASLVILADLGCRTLFAPSELPAGIFTAAIGAPFFIFLLFFRRKHDA